MDEQYLQSLETTLKQTLVPDSNVVKQAVNKLQKELYPLPAAIPALFQLLLTSQDEAVKQLAAVEARKRVSAAWETLDPLLKPLIKSNLLQHTFGQSNKKIRHSCARTVAAIAIIDLELNQWDELLPALVSGVQDANPQTKEMAIFTLFAVLETQATPLTAHVGDFLDLYAGLLRDESRTNRVNAVLALDVLAQYLEELADLDQSLINKFKQCIPGMVEVLKEVISLNDEDLAKAVFNVFNNFVFVDAKLIGDHLVDLIQFMCEIASNTQLDAEYRAFALQFLISSISYRKSRISQAKLGPGLTKMAAKISAEEIDEDAELAGDDEENENEENEPPALALRLIAMMAGELPPSQVIVPLFDNLQQMLPSQNKFERRGGLLAIKVASLGAPDFIRTQIYKVLPAIVAGLKDLEVIVQVAALKTLANLTAELQDSVAEYHEELLPLIINVINNATSMAAYKFACFALDGLIEFMSHDAMGTYVQPLMEKLTVMLQQASNTVLQTAIVSAIGSTAFAAGKAFTPYFSETICILEPFVASGQSVEGLSEDDIELRACAFENISTIARAVGPELFSQYAKPLVEAAYHAVKSDHSRIRESGFGFISNMSKVYGAEFASFLEQIVPEILTCLQQEEFSFNENFDEDGEEDESPVNIHTGITIEKEIAALALAELAKGTGKAFAPYVDACIKVLSDQVENSTGMREAALQATLAIVKAMFVAQYGEDFKAPKGVPTEPYVDQPIMELINTARTVAIPPLEYEFEITMVASILDGLADLINTIGAIAVVDASNTEQLKALCVELMKLLKREHPCQVEDDEGPEDDDEDASEVDAVIFESILEVLVNLAAALEGDFNEIFSSFKDVILSRLNSKLKPIRVACIGALSEISYGLKSANPYTQELLQVFIDRLQNDKALEVKSNSAYGVGVLIENSNQDLSGIYQNVLELLFYLLSKAGKTVEDDEEAKDVVDRSYANACGCVARMYLKQPQSIPTNHVVPAMLERLPLETAFEENDVIFNMIIKLYEVQDSTIEAETARIIKVFSEVFVKDAKRVKLAEESTLGREETLDSMKQFPKEGLREKVIELLKFLDSKLNGAVSQDEVLKLVLA